MKEAAGAVIFALHPCSPRAVVLIKKIPEPNAPIDEESQEAKYPFKRLTVGTCFFEVWSDKAQKKVLSNRLRKAVAINNKKLAPARFALVMHNEHSTYEIARIS